MTGARRAALAKKYLLELLGLTTMVKDEERPGRYVEVPQFSEAGTYETLGKEQARVVRSVLGKLANALGIPDIDGRHDRIRTISDHRANLYELQDAVEVARTAARRLDFEVRLIEDAEDFADELRYAEGEIKNAFQNQKYGSTPAQGMARIARALSIDPETGRMEPKYKRDEKRKKAKTAKKKAKK